MRKSVTDDKAIIAAILNEAEVLWLALTDEKGPYCVPVNFAWEDNTIYIHSGIKGRKAACLNSRAPLAFSAAVDVTLRPSDDSACDLGYLFRSVMGQGTPRQLDGEAKRHGLDLITLKYAGREMPYKEKILSATNVYAVDTESMTARVKK